MNKYISVFSTSIKQESKSFANGLSIAVSFAVIIFIFKELWSFIYSHSASSLINGYDLKMMIWYMIMAEVLYYAVNARSVTQSYSSEIKSGRLAYQLNKPYNYFIYQIFNQSGVIFWKLLFLIPAALLMGLVLLGPIQNFSALFVLPILCSFLFAVFLTSIIYGLVGLLAFWIEESTPFTWIVQKFQLIFGLFFPPEFFPGIIQTLITYSPVYAMVSGPCKLLSNFSWELFLNVSISQICYSVVFVALGFLLYHFGKRKVNINGG